MLEARVATTVNCVALFFFRGALCLCCVASRLTRACCVGRRFDVLVQEVILDWTTDSNGVSHTANVLADAGFIKLKRESKGSAEDAAPEGRRSRSWLALAPARPSARQCMCLPKALHREDAFRRGASADSTEAPVALLAAK